MIQIFSSKLSSEIDVENLGVSRLKSFIEQNDEKVKVTYLNINENYRSQMHNVILESKLFGFSLYNDCMEFFVEVINEIKHLKPNAIIVVGSKFVTLYYKEILQAFKKIDYAILGDGEKALLDLIRYIDSGEDIKSISSKHENIASVDSLSYKYPAVLKINKLPWPDRSWMKESNNKYLFAFICDSQGCSGKCSFCTWNNYHTEWNGRSAEDIYNEIVEINTEFGIRWFYFTSSSFEDLGLAGKNKIRKLCLLLKENNKNFAFRYYLRADTFDDTVEDMVLLRLMRSSGFKLVIVGIESGNDEDLRIFNKRASLRQNRITLNLLKEADIYSQAIGFIMFNPYTTHYKLTQNYRFLCEFGIGSMARFTSKLRVYIQTDMYEQVKKDGLLTYEGSFYQNEGCTYQFKHADIECIDNFVRKYFGTNQIQKLNVDFETSSNFIISFYEFVENGLQYKTKMMEIVRRNSELLKEYFFHLYVEFDLRKSEELLSDIIKEYSKNVNETITLKFGLYKKLNKQIMLGF